MDRPTASLRRLLLLESIQKSITNEIALTKAQMREAGLRIIERKVNHHDVWIQYQYGQHHDEAIFMRKMLDAESKNRAKRTGMITP
ncbi:hypothetical protein [Alicyclobacillus fodiniaquatilis]|uniref:Uncharacterized protein n=1 Tax=Alicyclobacillus fodiniaquatilis TaxID=1661150 RepID=A0ABW4JGD6_9BACL